MTQVLHDARGGVLVLDDLSEVAAPSDREAGGVSSTGKELIEVRHLAVEAPTPPPATWAPTITRPTGAPTATLLCSNNIDSNSCVAAPATCTDLSLALWIHSHRGPQRAIG